MAEVEELPVTKFDTRQIKTWMEDLKKVLPIIPSKNGLVLSADERPLFTYYLNKAGGAASPEEAYAFAALLENLPGLIDSILSQQRDFVMVRRMLAESLMGLSQRKLDEARKLLDETSYIEGRR